MHPISLHPLIAPEISAVELVRLASDLRCEHVCLFLQTPHAAPMSFPVVKASEIGELRRVMNDLGVSAHGITSFALAPDLDVASFAPALERGAMLGGTRASVRVLDTDETRATDKFAQLCTLAASLGIAASIEFTGFNASDALPQAVRIVRGAGCGAITLDALHVVRTGTSIADLQALGAGLIGYVQLCDGPRVASAEDYAHEGALDRLPPGEGAFPLRALLALVPEGRPVSLEVPMERLRRVGVSAKDRAQRVVDATRRLLDSSEG